MPTDVAGPGDEAEDVVQDTWIAFLRGIERFEGRSAFKTWLFRVLANRARSRAVREARYVPLDLDDGVDPPYDITSMM